MEVILIALVLILVDILAICWVQSDMNKELVEKNEVANKEIIRLQQQNYYLESENKALKSNLKANKEIICYTCGGNGDCAEGCRFTAGAAGCRKYWRQE